MVNYKKLLYLILCLTISLSILCFDKTDKIFSALSGHHIRIFAVENLFDKPLEYKEKGQSKTNIQYWQESISQLDKFIRSNAENNPKILKILNNLLNLNSDLINNIKLAYNLAFSEKSKKIDQKTKKDMVNKFIDIEKKIKLQNIEVEKTSFLSTFKKAIGISKEQSKEKAKSLLKKFIVILDTTTEKAIKDFNKKLAF